MKNTRSQMKDKKNYSRKLKSGICDGFCCDATFRGLQEWYKAKFEKLGWMILAKERGMNDKVMEYQNSIKRLEKSIEHKLQYHTKDSDRKDDLKIMLENVAVLKQHVDKDFQ